MLSKLSRLHFLSGVALVAGLGACATGSQSLEANSAASAEWPQIASPHSTDPETEQRIAAIVSGMSLRQKIGQMTQADIRSVTPEQVREHYLGSVLNGGGAWPGGNKRSTAGDWVALSRSFYDASMSTDMPVKVPIIWGTDAVHGHNNVFGATQFPHNIGLGAAHDPELVGRIAHLTAKQVRATGITWVFAPTLAVVQNPRWGRTYEGYSSDPELVRSYAKSFVTSMQGDLVGPDTTIASAKHFIGDGGTWLGKDQGETRASRDELIRTHAPGYFGALETGVQNVMISYSGWTDTGAGVAHGKMHGNRELITDVLKGKLGFDGFVVSDWNAIEQVDGCTRTHCPQAINAGIDMVMVPDDWKKFIDETVADVEAGTIPMSRIDDAVTRILRVKFRIGLMEHAPFLDASAEQDLASDLVRATAREAVAKSLVLLKNGPASPLPLQRDAKILLVGEAADKVTAQMGGWSLTWQGDETDDSDYPIADDMLSAVTKALGDGGSVDVSKDARGVDLSRYDAVIMVMAEAPYAEMKGDIVYPATLRHTSRYPDQLDTLARVYGKGVPVVSVLFSGRPVYANDLMNLSDAFIAAWLPGTEARGITDVLFEGTSGRPRRAFTGRLPFAWPGVPCPETANQPELFSRGFGLDTTKRGDSRPLPIDNRLSCPALAD
ncbi:glycoside hydrolase family 3 C-terminal domain-containing protein [Sphingopyxis sp. XHP0097]|uniref:Glycoside hydrolase family 3 C-terminal domain-containing protein n=1 Tax=Sphingopyxis jiangsuensis TaxID=2871171 RepID=A0ABS7MCI1_9SPHN|nr:MULTISPECIES: glycoside hydrolase family 3 N-terminal domain-containing protein [Sphingopyxis]MBY4636528.1 glycoside hydrolase family 3 C-terminal domain-containing protein [Sphingopyxis jiangsuensis]